MSKILIITEVPFWHRSKGNQQRIASMVEYLAKYHKVDIFFIGLNKAPTISDLNIYQVIPYTGVKYITHKLLQLSPYFIRNKIVGLLNKGNYTRNLKSFRSEKVSEALGKKLNNKSYNAVIIEYVWNSYLIDEIDRSRSIVMLDTHDIFYQRVESYAKFGKVPDKSITREQEIEAFKKFDYLIAIQQKEYQFLNTILPGHSILSMHPQNIDDQLYLDRLHSYKTNETIHITYFAAYADMNVDAIKWFVDTVWNDELAETFCLNIYGSICDGLKLAKRGVIIGGRVAEIQDAYRKADIVINPQRFGSGLKIKSVEALAHGVPLVCTTIGAQGLDLEKYSAFLVADNPEQFITHLNFLKESKQRQELSNNALKFAREHLSPEACYKSLNRVINSSIKQLAS